MTEKRKTNEQTLREKCLNTEFFSGPYFPAFLCRNCSYVPNKPGVLIIRGGWKISKNQITGGVLISEGERGWKNKKISISYKMKYKLFNVYYLQSKEYKGKE